MKEYCIIYHGNCSDGFGAAWALWRLLGDAASYHPAIHGHQPPKEIDGTHVVIADFSFPRQTLLAIKNRAKSILVLDHHKSAKEDLDGLDFAYFDMTRSGAGITWDHHHGKESRPPLINYIEDRDLWRWSLPNSREILAVFESVKPSFASFDEFNERLESSDGMAEIVVKGSAILEYKNAKVRSLAEKSYLVDLSAICGLADPTMQVPCVNTSIFHSEVGNLLAQTHPMAIIWYRAEDGLYRHSLRSAGKVDCSRIARFWGGGGHADAAGFTISEPLVPIIRKE